jgi:hypothetical protein
MVVRYTGSRRRVTAVTWKTGKSIHVTFEDDLRLGGNRDVDRLGVGNRHALTAHEPGEQELRDPRRQRRDAGEDRCRIGADRDGDLHPSPLALVTARLSRAVLVLLPVHAGRVAVEDLHPVDADVHFSGRRVPRDDQRKRDERSGVLRPARQDGEPGEIDLIAGFDDLLRRGRANGLREDLCEFGDLRNRFELVEEAFGRLRVEQRLESGIPLFESRETECAQHAAAGREKVDRDGQRRTGHVLEEKSRAVPLDAAVRDFRDLETRRDLPTNPSQVPVGFERSQELREIAKSHGRYRDSDGRP